MRVPFAGSHSQKKVASKEGDNSYSKFIPFVSKVVLLIILGGAAPEKSSLKWQQEGSGGVRLPAPGQPPISPIHRN